MALSTKGQRWKGAEKGGAGKGAGTEHPRPVHTFTAGGPVCIMGLARDPACMPGMCVGMSGSSGGHISNSSVKGCIELDGGVVRSRERMNAYRCVGRKAGGQCRTGEGARVSTSKQREWHPIAHGTHTNGRDAHRQHQRTTGRLIHAGRQRHIHTREQSEIRTVQPHITRAVQCRAVHVQCSAVQG